MILRELPPTWTSWKFALRTKRIRPLQKYSSSSVLSGVLAISRVLEKRATKSFWAKPQAHLVFSQKNSPPIPRPSWPCKEEPTVFELFMSGRKPPGLSKPCLIRPSLTKNRLRRGVNCSAFISVERSVITLSKIGSRESLHSGNF